MEKIELRIECYINDITPTFFYIKLFSVELALMYFSDVFMQCADYIDQIS